MANPRSVAGSTAILLGLFLITSFVACGGDDDATVAVPGVDDAEKSAAAVRAERRLFDGAPPVIPHEPFGAPCVSCHGERGMTVPGIGYSPPAPHAETPGMGAIATVARGGRAIPAALARCEQCHVFQRAAEPWRESSFVGLRQDLRRGERLHPLAPPVMPHRVFMRENCQACHAGPAAREEIRTDHPQRARCRQCHVEQVTTETFVGGRG